MDVSLFDWLRWVEVPIWLALAGWIGKHIHDDHKMELVLTSKLADLAGQLEGIQTVNSLMLSKLIPDAEIHHG